MIHLCTQPTLGDEMMVPVIYRDFRFQNPPEFEAGVLGLSTAFTGIVANTLDSEGKPVYAGIGGASHVTSVITFAEWYRTTPWVNYPTASKLALWNNGQGAYVNRYGEVPVPAGCPGPNNDTAYGGCTTQCKWGPFCGDGVVNGPEECDLGKMNGSGGSNGCTFACTKPHYCGDGSLDTNLGEQCDLGALNGVSLDATGNPSDAPGSMVRCDTTCIIPIWVP